MNNLYEVLGIDKNSTEKEIKRAYALKLREFPPESESEEFQNIKYAYDVLSNNEKREEYNFEIEFGEKINFLEEQIDLSWNNNDYKSVIAYCSEILSINENLEIKLNNNLHEYMFKLVLALESDYNLEEALMQGLKLVKIADNYEYQKKVAELFFIKRDFISSLKYLKLAYEKEPLDNSLLNSLVEIARNVREYSPVSKFLQSQINENISKTINGVHFEGLLRIAIIKKDVKLLKSSLENIEKLTTQSIEDKIKLSLDLYDKALNLYEERFYYLSKILSEKANELYQHEEINKLYNLSSKMYNEEKMYNEFLEDRHIIKEIKDFIFLYKGPNIVENEDLLFNLKNETLAKVKNIIIKNPNLIIKSIRALKFKYLDYFNIDEELFEQILDISHDRKILYDQFNDLSFDYNICYTVRKLVSFYEANMKNEITDNKRDELFEETLNELDEERPEEIVLSIRVIKDDYFKIYEIIPDKFNDIMDEARNKIKLYYNNSSDNKENKISILCRNIKNNLYQSKLFKKSLPKYILILTILFISVFIGVSNLMIGEDIDSIIEKFHISPSQIVLIVILIVISIIYLINKKKTTNNSNVKQDFIEDNYIKE